MIESGSIFFITAISISSKKTWSLNSLVQQRAQSSHLNPSSLIMLTNSESGNSFMPVSSSRKSAILDSMLSFFTLITFFITNYRHENLFHASLFNKLFDRKPFFKKSSSANLLRKGLIENPDNVWI